MIFLAVTQSGLHEAIESCKSARGAIWCGCDAISESEFHSIAGLSITRFNYALEHADPETLADAVATIIEHHPGKKIWIESTSQSTR